MRSLSRRHAADAATVAFAGVLLSVAVFESLGSSTSKLALFAAVAIVAEALQRPHDELLPDALEGERFTLTAPIHLAALLVAGPWVAAAVAGWSVIAVGPFRGLAPMEMVRRAAAFGASALAGGAAFTLAGGSVGHLTLPEDLLPAALAGLVYVTARTLLEGLATQRPALPDPLTAVAGVGLGIVLAFAALRELWLAIALVPLLLLVERLYARVVGLRYEMATALETFANIVDERDPSTYGHSVRVARYVQDLASGLGLPAVRGATPLVGGQAARPGQGGRRCRRPRQAGKAEPGRMGHCLARAAPLCPPTPSLPLRGPAGPGRRVPPGALQRHGVLPRPRRRTSRWPRTS